MVVDRRGRARPTAAALWLVLGCGPTAPVDATDASTGTGESPSTSRADATGVPPSTTGSSTTRGVEDTSVDSSEDDGFITRPDFICHHCSYCDTWSQDCPLGEKCTPWANDGSDVWNAPRCSPIYEQPGQVGDECTVESSATSGIDTCDLGAMCWDVDPETDTGTCVSHCSGDPSNSICEDPATDCLIVNDGVLALCLPTCAPLADECGPSRACIASEHAFVCVPSRDGAVWAESCVLGQLPYDCAPGLVCAPSASVGPPCDEGEPGCCTSYCDLTSADPAASCGPGQICAPWWGEEPAPVGLEGLGACVLP